ncbi:adenylyl-sulfate kinase [Mammaliicoccus sciuri]|uniref:adenylyl-sulfate kinase n=1 Tax=Mammaliicoccus sciuri TaxID=1296 RepID=UPI001E344A6D|nr:adenylyl-sulfate kinase [Mammaliicoccus sciuri]MCD8789036.1 adenylyl-sulfate kinase [Mammaliicoccus sciuri]
MSASTNITWHDSEVTKAQRQERNGHKSVVIWFTGLSGSGKSTISVALEKALFEQNITSYRLDGDNIRHGLNQNLGFSPEDRKENIRRIGEVGKLMVDAGVVTMTAFISPYEEDRNTVRDILEDGEFIEVFTKCSLDECESRDPKELYKKARSGEIKEFTGINAPYEEPSNPEIVIDTENESVEESVDKIVAYLKENQYL